jgi:hypothetical protein
MSKSWKSLFIKNDEPENKSPSKETLSFPVQSQNPQHTQSVPVQPITDPAVSDVLQVYENGLESINMPGFDFYEFYKTVITTGHPSEQTYLMAYQMAKTLDKTITPSKLLHDAEFYISKINEVHSNYVTQGQQKLNGIDQKKTQEKTSLQTEIDNATRRITELRTELQHLEAEIGKKRSILMKVDDTYYPQEKTIREKLSANDVAKKISIEKLNMIKEGITRFIHS